MGTRNNNGERPGWLSQDVEERLLRVGLCVPEILLPKRVGQTWPVIACDQHTSRKEYWARADALAGREPSTLRMIVPEAWLDGDQAALARAAGDAARGYLDSGVFGAPFRGFVYVERKLEGGVTRRGIVLAADLDAYEHRPGKRALMRATENTVAERLPARVTIRGQSPLELPHAMALIDDPCDALLSGLSDRKGCMRRLYDVALMLGGGEVAGYAVETPELVGFVVGSLEALARDGLLFAVGDGNHSLAAAKLHWEGLRDSGAGHGHPARFALIEAVNVHSPACGFQPIHRAVFGDGGAGWAEEALAFIRDRGCDVRAGEWTSAGVAGAGCAPDGRSASCAALLPGGRQASATVSLAETSLPVAALQSALDALMAVSPGLRVDYVHGDDELCRLSAEEGCICFFLPPLDKDGLFKEASRGAVLPRKAFSIGRAQDKRYYMEARLIV